MLVEYCVQHVIITSFIVKSKISLCIIEVSWVRNTSHISKYLD